MKTVIEQADQEFLQRLRQSGGGTVQEICAATGVTATAVRHRLVRLQQMGMIARTLQRNGRGRPHHIYQVTAKAVRELGDNYAGLAQILWRELNNIEEPAVRQRVVGRVEEALVRLLGGLPVDGALSDRLDRLSSAMQERGFEVEIDRQGLLPILRENSCPYFELASSDPAICEMEQAVFRRLLGAEVKLTQCCLDGHHCCEFEAADRTQAERVPVEMPSG